MYQNTWLKYKCLNYRHVNYEIIITAVSIMDVWNIRV